MKTITVQVKEDHLETLARTKPMVAIAELIWNALDAEAKEVRVEFIENALEGLETIRIVDDGHGLHYDDALIVFQNLGGSWKREGARTHVQQRMLHGKYGKGRFRAFSLGNRVEWCTVYQDGDQRFTYSILGKAVTPGEFTVTDPRGAEGKPTGMQVDIGYPPISVGQLRGVKAVQEVTDIFALYLRQYPDVRIVYDQVPIDPANAEQRYTDYVLDQMVMENGEHVHAALTVVEWNLAGKRGLYFCDEKGFMLQCVLPRLHFRGFSYTAYVKSEYHRQLDKEGLLQAGDLSPDVRQILDAARRKLREHFTLREAEFARDIISEWRELGLYPYEGEAVTESDFTERRIFEIYATHLNQIFPDFATSSPRNRRLVLRLLQELVKSEPTRVARLLDELVTFPEEKEEEILELVQQ
ncbi:MAG: ATP-binding protein [Candidatus Hydrogenedentes bacterium]|nr:ATP-binding protein [Candidatus Hydrogenedentota bacterium]